VKYGKGHGNVIEEKAGYPLRRLMSLFELEADPTTSEKAPIVFGVGSTVTSARIGEY
jgi:hypothetical protein